MKPAPESAPAPDASVSQAGATLPKAAASPVDYGVLGPPTTDGDPQASTRSAQENLALFRDQELHPPGDDHPMDWTAVIEFNQAQRARFYAAQQIDPSLITARDQKWLKVDEATILSVACGNIDDPNQPVNIKAKDCVGVQP